jgi:hypothetical protein
LKQKKYAYTIAATNGCRKGNNASLVMFMTYFSILALGAPGVKYIASRFVQVIFCVLVALLNISCSNEATSALSVAREWTGVFEARTTASLRLIQS